jgi:CBS domain-containing protein
MGSSYEELPVKVTTVADVMTTAVAAVPDTAAFKDIVKAIRSSGASAVPVLTASGQVAGVISEADLICKLAAPALPAGPIRLAWRLHERSKANGETAAELMTTPAVTIGPAAAAADAARVMQSRHLKRLPVVDEDGRLAGVVSRVDVLAVFERRDAEIRAEVIDHVIAAECQLDPSGFDVTVRSGIVTIGGTVDDRAVALNLLGVIQRADGVVGVRDQLAYPSQSLPGSELVRPVRASPAPLSPSTWPLSQNSVGTVPPAVPPSVPHTAGTAAAAARA